MRDIIFVGDNIVIWLYLLKIKWNILEQMKE